MFFNRIFAKPKIATIAPEGKSETILSPASTGNLGAGSHIKVVSSDSAALCNPSISRQNSLSPRIPSAENLTDHVISVEETSVPVKTEKEIFEQNTLLSSVDFKTAVGPARWMHGATYRSLESLLKSYEANSIKVCNADKIKQLAELEEKALCYRNEKEAIAQRPWFFRSPLQSDHQRLEQRRKAAACLLEAIANERKKLTLPISFSQNEERYSEDNFAAGAMTRVSRIGYNDGSQAIFKPISKSVIMESNADKMGIPRESTLAANLAGRAVATYTTSQLLDWDIVPKTGFATHNDQIGSCQTFVKGESLRKEKWEQIPAENILPNSPIFSAFEAALDPQIAETDKNFSFTFHSCSPDKVNAWATKWIEQNPKPPNQAEQRKWAEKMKKAVIAAFFKTKKITASEKVFFPSEVNFANPQLQKTLSKAHLLDLLTGQLDRNAGNFIYTHAGESWDAKLIDNDLSFPEKFDSFEKETFDIFNPGGKFPSTLPDLMDAEAATAIEGLTSDILTPELKKIGLTDKEIEATLQRLQLLKTHITTARGNVSPAVPRLVTEWNQETFDAQKDSRNNYIWMGVEAKKEITPLKAHAEVPLG